MTSARVPHATCPSVPREYVLPVTISPNMTGALPSAVMWDMNGTLVDTEPYWIAEEHRLVADHGGVWTDEHAHQLVGHDLLDSGQHIPPPSPLEPTPAEP